MRYKKKKSAVEVVPLHVISPITVAIKFNEEDYISLGVTTDEICNLLADSHETVLSKSTEEDF